MEDSEIIALFEIRSGDAIRETQLKYGNFCMQIACNILSSREDAEECVSDAYMKAWNAIPPAKPRKLGIWLGKIVRNTAYNLWKKNHCQKRDAALEQILGELEDCIPARESVEASFAGKELEALLNRWLAGLPKQDRVLFLRRYWSCESLRDLERDYEMSHGKMAKKMYNLRMDLQNYLAKEDYFP